MKSKYSIFTLVAFAALIVGLFDSPAQTNAPASDPAATASAATTNDASSTAVSTNSTTTVPATDAAASASTDTNAAPATDTAATTQTPAANAGSTPAATPETSTDASAAPAQTTTSATSEAPAATTNAPATADATASTSSTAEAAPATSEAPSTNADVTAAASESSTAKTETAPAPNSETPATTEVAPATTQATPATTATTAETPATKVEQPADAAEKDTASETKPAAPETNPTAQEKETSPVQMAEVKAEDTAPAAKDAADGGAAAAADASAAAAPAGPPIVPLIVMDDVPLTDAIRNLARQASLNYMLDPRIGFGQPGPDGKPTTQPMVSLRWENVTAEQALNALLNNYSLQLVDDPKTKISRITVKDPTAPDPLTTKVIQLKFSNPSNLVSAVKATFTDKRSQVMADIRTSQLVVLATEREMVEVDKLVTRLDTMTKQVLIEARLVELSANPTTSKGFDWSGTVQAQNISVGNNLQSAPVPSQSLNYPLASAAGIPTLLFDTARGFNPSTAFLDADGVKMVFSFLNTYSDAKVLSAPRTVTLDNEPARISVTRASPIINVTAGTANTTGGSQITYTNLGVILDVTPRISANDYVNIHVVPEVSRVFDTVSKTIAGELYQADEYDLRKIETRVLIPSGNTLVMGGMVQDDISSAGNKVPLLGDIPIVGFLFQSHSKSRARENVYIFLTPTIVQESDFQPTKTKFLKVKVPTQDVTEPDWSSWDDGHPASFFKKSKTAGDDDFSDSYLSH